MYLKRGILSLNLSNLVSDKLIDPIYNRPKALKNFVVRKSHISFFDASFREFCFDADIDADIYGPFLPIIPKIGLNSILKIHDALGINPASSPRAFWQLHYVDLFTDNVAEISIQSS
jgi:hypothetical protein